MSDTLNALEYKSNIPTLQNIKNAIRKKFDHALTATFCILPLYLIENPDHAGSIHFLSDSEEALAVRDAVFSNPKYLDVLKRLLPEFVKLNLL